MGLGNIVWSLLIVAAGVAAAQLVDYYRVQHGALRRRGWECDKAVTFFRVHQQALDEFTRFEDPTRRLKETLIRFSRQMSREQSAHSLLMRAVDLGSSVLGPSDEAIAVVADLSRLRESHPRQAQTFDRAVRCGLFGALMRWPDTGKAFDRAFAYLVVDQEREVLNVVSAANTFGTASLAQGALQEAAYAL